MSKTRQPQQSEGEVVGEPDLPPNAGVLVEAVVVAAADSCFGRYLVCV
ncbi:hypothetical protein [Ktedonobacter sp. SOSP1-52]|nr:hypothetical protein [Ktedonobacter sp. SOSP1-52]